jgi:hypothetical protein
MVWPYTKHATGLISVTLDNNVWDFLYQSEVNLKNVFPRERFALFITREVEIETEAIPPTKLGLREYIARSTEDANIQTAWTFGFDTGESPIRRGTLGQSTFQSQLESDIRKELLQFIHATPKGSGLHRNEGDISVALASFFSIVLTMEKGKAGPLQFARENGGQILQLSLNVDAAKHLRALVEDRYACIDSLSDWRADTSGN